MLRFYERRYPDFLGRSFRLITIFGCLFGTVQAQSGTFSRINDYPLPGADSVPLGIVTGPDGALWFTENEANRIGRITVDGVITEYPGPGHNSQFAGITVGPDGALWFTEFQSNLIGRITTAGALTEYPVPTAGSGPYWITAGPDGALWFTEFYGNQIGRITTGGSISEYRVPTPECNATGITLGPDGALWFTEYSASRIGRISVAGTITEYSIYPSGGGTFVPWAITTGPDGAMWFTSLYQQPGIGRMTTAGAVSQYDVSTPNTAPSAITVGPDGALWFTVPYSLARITTSGIVTEYPLPTDRAFPSGITAGPDGALWFTEYRYPAVVKGDKIGRAPACGLGFSASFADATLTMNFDLGIDTPATFDILLHTAGGVRKAYSQAIPAMVPPRPFTIMLNSFPDLGMVTVEPTLAMQPGGAGLGLCAEWNTVNTAPR